MKQQLFDGSMPSLIHNLTLIGYNSDEQPLDTPLIHFVVSYPITCWFGFQYTWCCINKFAKSGYVMDTRDIIGSTAITTLLEHSATQRVYSRWSVVVIAKLLCLGVNLKIQQLFPVLREQFENMLLDCGREAIHFMHQSGYRFTRRIKFGIAVNEPLSLKRIAANVIRHSLQPSALIGVYKLPPVPGWPGFADYITMDSLRNTLW